MVLIFEGPKNIKFETRDMSVILLGLAQTMKVMENQRMSKLRLQQCEAAIRKAGGRMRGGRAAALMPSQHQQACERISRLSSVPRMVKLRALSTSTNETSVAERRAEK